MYLRELSDEEKNLIDNKVKLSDALEVMYNLEKSFVAIKDSLTDYVECREIDRNDFVDDLIKVEDMVFKIRRKIFHLALINIK